LKGRRSFVVKKAAAAAAAAEDGWIYLPVRVR
jgi:hypothetical protein